jgi:hypothetical protein
MPVTDAGIRYQNVRFSMRDADASKTKPQNSSPYLKTLLPSSKQAGAAVYMCEHTLG